MSKDRSLIIVFTILLQNFIIIFTYYYICIADNLYYLKKTLPLTGVLMLIITLMAIISIKQVEESLRNRIKLEFMDLYTKQVKDLLTTIHSQRHEHTRHIQTVQSMLILEEYDEAVNYINGIADNYWQLDELVYTGNPALTALINNKQYVASTQGIDFPVAVKCNLDKLRIEPWDLNSIMGNLIDNAFEAALEDKYPRVSIEFKYEDDYYNIYIKNNGAKMKEEDIEKIFTPGYSTKGVGERGYGMHIVNTLVKRYQGNIDIIASDTTTILLSFKGGGDDAGSSVRTFGSKAG